MPRQLKEIRNFKDGIILNASERDIPDSSSVFSLNINPVAEAGILEAINNDKLIATINGVATTSPSNLSWSETDNNNTTSTDTENSSEIVIRNINSFMNENHSLMEFTGSQGQKELLNVHHVEPFFNQIDNRTTGDDFEISPISNIGVDDTSFTVISPGPNIITTADGAQATVTGFDAGTKVGSITCVHATGSTYVNDTFTIHSADGTTVVYKCYNDSSGASGTQDGDFTRVQLNGVTGVDNIRNEFNTAITNADYGHGTRFTVALTTGVITLTWKTDAFSEYLQPGDYFSLVTAGGAFTGRDGHEIIKIKSMDYPNN